MATRQVTVGVLLPLRLETRFGPGQLLLRIVPDEPWFTGHDPRVSTGEVDALTRYAAAAGEAPGGDDLPPPAWATLVAQVGGARAVYLVRTFTTTGADGHLTVRPPTADEQRTEPALPRIGRFPAQLHVWLARGGAPPALAASLDVDRDRLLADFPDPDLPDDRRWWEDWDEAKRVGLGVELDLPGDPNDIDALYVTGLGDADPSAHLADQRDEGRLGLVAPGTPTNSVSGAPAAPLGPDPAGWWAVLQGNAGDTDRLVSRALSGDPDLLGALPGPDEPHRSMAAAAVGALWPALWGFAADDVWSVTSADDDPPASAWAEQALFPEGPYPTLRVGSQPYGLLPATVLSRWRADPLDPPLEAGLVGPLERLRDRYRDAATARGNTVGATEEQLLDLIGQLPTSAFYRHRLAWPLELWWLAFGLVGGGAAWTTIDLDWRHRYGVTRSLGLSPARRYGARHAAGRVTLPLVVPNGLPEGQDLVSMLKQLVDLAQRSPAQLADTGLLDREVLPAPAASVLLRLVVRSLQVAVGDVGREKTGEGRPLLDPIVRADPASSRLQRWISSVSDVDLQTATPATARLQRVIAGVIGLMGIAPARLERLLAATVDSATFRIDPWLVALPARRLDTLLDAGEAQPRLGAYGWVDGPRPGAPGPTSAGLLHAPSPAQALTAAVLRDRAVNDPSATRWQLDLTSRAVRDADGLAEQVRVGSHLGEVVGREVERVVGGLTDVTRLRGRFPLRTEHEGRRVCDGLAVLAADPDTLGLTADHLAGLDRLRRALDAYGDLLVAEAVHHVTEGRADVAGAVMDAAAGLGRPPQLALLRTTRHGRAVSTSAVLALRSVPEPALPADDAGAALVGPAALADAATAALVEAQLGPATSWTFVVATLGEDGDGPGDPRTTVSLADLDLAPADALALTLTDLLRLAAAAGATALGSSEDAVTLDGGTGPLRYERAARLLSLVGRRPALPDALTDTTDAPADPAPATADLARRYSLVHRALSALLTRLQTASDPTGQEALLRAAWRWGVAPEAPPADPPPADGGLAVRVGRAVDLLAARVAGRPAPDAAASLAAVDLVDAITALVSPTGQLAVTSRVPAGLLSSLAAADGAPAGFDDTWLPVVAAVRDRLAAVEAHQLAAPTELGGGPAFRPWSNKPVDPWQLDPADTRRLVVAYAAGGLALDALGPADPVALAALDRFTEVVPAEDQTTGAAFGFDAPAARAPQAILLAVPPDTDEGLTDDVVVEIVAEARDLGRARMARPADLPEDLTGLLPSALLPATGATAVPIGTVRLGPVVPS